MLYIQSTGVLCREVDALVDRGSMRGQSFPIAHEESPVTAGTLHRHMLAVAAALLLAGCGSAATPAATEAPKDAARPLMAVNTEPAATAEAQDTATNEPKSTDVPPTDAPATEAPTAAPTKPPPPTAVPVPTAMPAPAFAYDPSPADDLNCDDFSGTTTDPQAWWNARRSAEHPNPGGLDGDSDSDVCEEGDPRSVVRQQPVAPPPPAAPSGGGVPPVSLKDCPESHPVKGNIRDDGDRIYHVRGESSGYNATQPEVCFASAADAAAAGFRPPN